eukprot:366273-Chlamydomonas_euryale.AAC.7
MARVRRAAHRISVGVPQLVGRAERARNMARVRKAAHRIRVGDLQLFGRDEEVDEKGRAGPALRKPPQHTTPTMDS